MYSRSKCTCAYYLDVGHTCPTTLWWEKRAKLVGFGKDKTCVEQQNSPNHVWTWKRSVGTPFRGSRLPLAPRTNTGPYARPNGPTRLPPSQPGNGRLPDTGNSRSGNDRLHHQTRTNDGSDQVSGPTLGEVLDEVRRGREDQTKIRDDLKRINQLIAKLEEEYRKLNEQFKQQTDASFSVDTSVYKVIYSTIKLLTHDVFIHL